LIDGAFFLRRLRFAFPEIDESSVAEVADTVEMLACAHVQHRHSPRSSARNIADDVRQVAETTDLYRIFFYDCPPTQKKVHFPISRKSYDLGKSPQAEFRSVLHKHLRTVRKVALRLGRLNDDFGWRLKLEANKRLIVDPTTFHPTDSDFEVDIRQKGVDMRLGLDVASIAFKRQADQIILVAADADFVPAAKLARREGLDVVIDPMGTNAAQDLIEHCDGVRSTTLGNRPTRWIRSK
jgi:uncharacterized LabA/DUF88 family protein